MYETFSEIITYKLNEVNVLAMYMTHDYMNNLLSVYFTVYLPTETLILLLLSLPIGLRTVQVYAPTSLILRLLIV